MGRIFFRLVLGGITGKILGVAREVLLAALFGAGRAVAANRIALTATFIPINFFTADALTAGFLPLYVQYRQERPAMAAALYRSVRSLLAAFSLVLVLALLIGRHGWVRLLGPGLDAGTAAIAASMLGIAAVGVPFYVQYNLYTLVGLAHDDVRLINLRPSFQSLGLIGATLAAYKTGHVALLAWGFTIPYIVLCAFGAFWVHRRGYLTGGDDRTVQLPERAGYRIALAMFWRRLRPLLLVPVILQGSIAVERIVGSLLGVEVVAATEYARFVVDSLMALLAAPLGLAGLASFTKMAAHEVIGGLRRLIPPVLLTTVPLSLMLCINSTGIVTFVYARGEFDERAVATSSVMLLGFALGIWAQVVGYTFVKVLNARGANLRVTVVMAVSFSAAVAVNLLLYRYWGAFTIGAASSVCGVLMFLLSAHWLGVLRFCAGLLATLLPGAAAAGAVGYALRGTGFVRLAVSCAAILLVWGVYVTAVPSLRERFLSGLRRRDKREAAPPPVVRSNG
ncbi:lipid II flippase MurJ [Rhizomonospora bruguierae]|uniref:lipid II flippase MurJ n=1 Tax=Rhizomonospora bruguierae TaxID=1581705 RepID=UPI001BCED76F|nr:lipid II flippase MurJ [Micromonospora sp. NBRC 107566]